jgi:SAM-dependent methyltransferase
MPGMMNEPRNLDKAARRGEPSYVWREGQDRRLQMIIDAAGDRMLGKILDNGCGVGVYLRRLSEVSPAGFGLEYDFERAREARQQAGGVVQGAGEKLPFPDHSLDFILSLEVLEHVADDRAALCEMIRVLRTPHATGTGGGRIALFVPNRGYPFETHGIYWRGTYRFGNIPLVNYLPRSLRDRLAPHVRVYSSRDLERLFDGLPVQILQRTIIFGAYDNIIARSPKAGRLLRGILQSLVKTPLRSLGLSHFWVVEKCAPFSG